MYLATVRADTGNPNRASSAWTRRCPQKGIRDGHSPDQGPEGTPQGRPTTSPSFPGPPPPIGRPSPAMPAEHGVRLDDEERVVPSGKPSTDENPEPAVAVTEPWVWRPALQHDQLLTQAQILDDQVRSGFRPRRDRSPRPPDHTEPPSFLVLTGVFHRPGRMERAVDRVLAPYRQSRRRVGPSPPPDPRSIAPPTTRRRRPRLPAKPRRRVLTPFPRASRRPPRRLSARRAPRYTPATGVTRYRGDGGAGEGGRERCFSPPTLLVG
jgi:hypothetical protein